MTENVPCGSIAHTVDSCGKNIRIVREGGNGFDAAKIELKQKHNVVVDGVHVELPYQSDWIKIRKVWFQLLSLMII